MMAEAPGALNFTTFLNMLAESSMVPTPKTSSSKPSKSSTHLAKVKSPTKSFWMPLLVKPPDLTRKKLML